MRSALPFHCYNTFLRDKYGRPVYRVPVNLTFSCPNRNDDGSGGCTFCGEEGAMAVHLNEQMDLTEQVKSGVEYNRRRYGEDTELMAYFQAYTSTNAPVDEVRKAFTTVLAQYPFRIITISTRPDCLPDEILDLFSELAADHDLWIELGIQTANDATLETINRGHTFAQSVDAVHKLQQRGIKAVAHVILGLPGESTPHYRHTAEKLAELPLSGLKIHNLHIVKNTAMEAAYRDGEISVMDEHEYGEVLIDFLRRTPADIPIMRLTSDTPDALLVAPKWWMKKSQFLQYIRKQMTQRGITQGDLHQSNGGDTPACETAKKQSANEGCSYHNVTTADGSVTFYSHHYKENFHCSAGALSEAKYKFIVPSKLSERLKTGPVRILDVGFGLGTNALSAFELADKSARLEIVTLEKERQVVIDSINAYPKWAHIYRALIEHSVYQEGDKSIRICWGDARKSLDNMVSECSREIDNFDLIFHDAFSTQKNPELWSLSFFRKETSLLKHNGVLLTYSNARPVRGALLRCGLNVGETAPYGRNRGGTIAGRQLSEALPLAENEQKLLSSTTAGVPYFDPVANWTRKRILKHRQRVVEKLISLGVPRRA